MCPLDDLVSPQSAVLGHVMKNNYVYHDCLNMLSAGEVHSCDERPQSQEDGVFNTKIT
jgi:hypothetical protein